MRKVKTFENCIGTGDVCCKVRSKYNMMVELVVKMELLKANEYGVNAKVSDLLLEVFETERAKLVQSVCKTCTKCEAAEKIKQAKAKAESDVEVAKQVLIVAEENLKYKMEVLEGFYS